MYKCISENICVAIKENGDQVMRQKVIKNMRTVKRETLKLISGWVQRSEDPNLVCYWLFNFTLLLF